MNAATTVKGRVPSWCDRVLDALGAGLEQRVAARAYGCADGVASSDHARLCALRAPPRTFGVAPRSESGRRPPPLGSGSTQAPSPTAAVVLPSPGGARARRGSIGRACWTSERARSSTRGCGRALPRHPASAARPSATRCSWRRARRPLQPRARRPTAAALREDRRHRGARQVSVPCRAAALPPGAGGPGSAPPAPPPAARAAARAGRGAGAACARAVGQNDGAETQYCRGTATLRPVWPEGAVPAYAPSSTSRAGPAQRRRPCASRHRRGRRGLGNPCPRGRAAARGGRHAARPCPSSPALLRGVASVARGQLAVRGLAPPLASPPAFELGVGGTKPAAALRSTATTRVRSPPRAAAGGAFGTSGDVIRKGPRRCPRPNRRTATTTKTTTMMTTTTSTAARRRARLPRKQSAGRPLESALSADHRRSSDGPC